MVIVVYDIPDNKRRTKLAHFLEGHGRRVQFSVFECFISLEQMRQLHQAVSKKVKASEDNVRFYWLSDDNMSMSLTIGSNKPKKPPNYYIF